MKLILRTAILIGAICLLAAVRATAASVGPGGYTNTFNTIPPAADWATLSIPGSGTDAYDADAEVNTSVTAGGVTAQTTSDVGDPPAANTSATWSSGAFYLQTRPTGNRATVLMGKFINDTGSNATQIGLSYLFTIAAGPVSEDSGKGTRVYFSLAGTPNSWTNITSLNTTAGNGGSSVSNASIALNWTNGGNLYLVWFDDNSSSGTDVANQYDNFSLRVMAGTPTNFFCLVSAPGDGATVPSGTLLTAVALTDHGTPPYTVEYFTNSGMETLVFASAGTSVTAPTT